MFENEVILEEDFYLVEDVVEQQNELLLEERVEIVIDKLYNEDIYRQKDLQQHKISKQVLRQMVNAIYKPKQKYVVLFSIEIIHDLVFRCNVKPSDIFFVSGSEVKAKKFVELGVNNYTILPHETFDMTCSWWDGEKDTYEKDTSVEFSKKIIKMMKEWIGKMTKDIMENVVVIGNPPYNGDSKKSGSLYDKFIAAAIEMKPKEVCMIVPSRWFQSKDTLGAKTKSFYESYARKDSWKTIKHFETSQEVFGADINLPGGVNWFVYDLSYHGKCNFNGEEKYITELSKDDSEDVIVNKLRIKSKQFIGDKMFSSKPYNIRSKSDDRPQKNKGTSEQYPIYFAPKNGLHEYWYVDTHHIKKNVPSIKDYKVIIAKANGDEPQHCGYPKIISPGEICSETFLVLFHSSSLEECKNFAHYMTSNLFMYAVSLNKKTQNMAPQTFSLVPGLDFSKRYSNEELYNMFDLSSGDISGIEFSISKSETISKYKLSEFVCNFDNYIETRIYKCQLV